MTSIDRGTNLPLLAGTEGTSRDLLLSRWLTLTRHTLPEMAGEQDWPIRLDHCFMRVCLDTALGRRWDTVVRRPAIRHMTEAELARAVAVAELVVRDPGRLPQLNAQSLAMRGLRS